MELVKDLQMRAFWMRVGLKFKDGCPSKKKDGDTETQKRNTERKFT